MREFWEIFQNSLPFRKQVLKKKIKLKQECLLVFEAMRVYKMEVLYKKKVQLTKDELLNTSRNTHRFL